MLIFFIISFFYYLIAPIQYSYEYCFVAQLLFLLNAGVLYYKDLKYEKFGFNALFSLAFFSMCYLFPVYVYKIAPDISFFQFGYNSDVISRCTGLSTLAYSVYSMGYMESLSKRVRTSKFRHSIDEIVSTRFLNTILTLNILVFGVFMLSGGFQFFQNQYLHNSSTSNPISPYLYQLVQVLSVLLVFTVHLKRHKLFRRITIITLLMMSLIIIMAGSRALPLILIISLFYLLIRKYNIGLSKIALFSLIGAVAMIVVGFVRGGNSDEGLSVMAEAADTQLGVLGVLQDLLVNNYNYYIIYDYVDTHGILWGKSMLGYLLAIIPFAQNIVVSVFGIPPYMLTSPSFVTNLVMPGSGIGLGTNIVGDSYLAFGLIGVIVFFYALGYIVVYLRKRFFLNELWGSIIYIQLVGGALYMARSSVIGGLRGYFWGILIVWFLLKQTNRRRLKI